MKFNWRVLAMTLLLPGFLTWQDAIAQTPVTIQSRPHILDSDAPARIEFGKLIYLSGIVMGSDNPDFGGFSGLQISADGSRLLAVSDKGKWLGAELAYEDGRLTGLLNAGISSLLGLDGRAIAGKDQSDAESLTLERPGNLAGPAYVSFEGNHRVWYYPQGLQGRPVGVTMPETLRQAPSNKGLEAFDRRADGALIALTEEWLDKAGNQTGWLMVNAGKDSISLHREGIFDPTDMEFLPDGDLLVLERRYTVAGGPGMQIRRIRADTLRPDALLDGEVLINLAARYGIDNFEGLATRTNDAGEIIIYIISDNNFNVLQKNLLLMFKLAN
ncbi:MAG: esterase-like activity of phytase family protein [Alphaproteobacteria bacterium]